MGMLQERRQILDQIDPTSGDIRLLQELLSTGNSTAPTISTNPMMYGLINIILVYLNNTSTQPALYPFQQDPEILIHN